MTETAATCDLPPYADPGICWRYYRWPDHVGEHICQCLVVCRTNEQPIQRNDVVTAMNKWHERHDAEVAASRQPLEAPICWAACGGLIGPDKQLCDCQSCCVKDGTGIQRNDNPELLRAEYPGWFRDEAPPDNLDDPLPQAGSKRPPVPPTELPESVKQYIADRKAGVYDKPVISPPPVPPAGMILTEEYNWGWHAGVRYAADTLRLLRHLLGYDSGNRQILPSLDKILAEHRPKAE